ncbi:MAG: putative superfamily hydrolase [Verrucomicrobiales bacterium]|nr:putative superfamily hydrolase [Verrucomicrobiales bacterium]
MNTNIRGVGFDLGDTLIYYRDTPLNWASLYPKALGCIAKSCGASPSVEELAGAGNILIRYNTRVVSRAREVSAEEIMSLVLRSWELDPVVHLPAAVEAFFTFFQQQMCVYPETIQILAALREQAIPTGILTDVPYGMPRAFVQRDLDGAGISERFNVLLTSVDVGVRKPETDGYLALADRLGIAPDEMLYVGNEPKDVIGAKRAGAMAALLDRAGSGGNHGQDFTIATLSSLRDIVLNGQGAS